MRSSSGPSPGQPVVDVQGQARHHRLGEPGKPLPFHLTSDAAKEEGAFGKRPSGGRRERLEQPATHRPFASERREAVEADAVWDHAEFFRI